MIGVTASDRGHRFRSGSSLTNYPHATVAVDREISIQIQIDGCQGPTEFTWPSVLVNGNLQVGRHRISLLKLPNQCLQHCGRSLFSRYKNRASPCQWLV